MRRYDCSQVTDGGAGIVLVSDRWLRANSGLLPGPAARIAGRGHRSAARHLRDRLDASEGDEHLFPHVRQTIADALQRAGIKEVFELDGIETRD